MADNKFGLSDALINAVRQVAENSAPLPRDERERDLERQSRLKPKNLDEALTPEQKKKFAKLAPPEDEITFADKIAGAKKNTKKVQEAKKLVDRTTDKMLKDDPAAGLIAKAVVGSMRLAGKGLKKIVGKEQFQVRNSDDIVDEGMFSVKTKKPKEGDIAPETLADKLNAQNAKLKPKSKTPHPGPVGSDVKEESEIDEATKKLTARERFIKGLKRGGYDVEASHAAAVKTDKEMKQKNSETMSTYAKEETELDEGLSRKEREDFAARRSGLKTPPTREEKKAAEEKRRKQQARRDSMSKAAQAAKPPKAKAYVSPDNVKPKARENETPNDDPRENIINQLRKLPVEGKHRITFKNGKTHLLSPAVVGKARTLHGNMQPNKKGDFQERLAASLESFQDAVKNPENEAPKPKGKEARLAPPDMRPDFHKRLSDMAAAHNARQKEKAKGK